MTGRWDAWTRTAVAAHPVLGIASALVVVALVQADSSTPIVGSVVLAAVALHLALALAGRRPTSALVVASLAMLGLATTPMPGWSTGVLLPSAVCFLLISWRVTTTAAPPWPHLALGAGLAGVVLAEGIAAARLGDDTPAGLQLLEAGLLLAVVVGTWAAARRTRTRRERAEADQRDRLTAVRLAERASVRRDLHDAIGHSLALMVAQAEAARVGLRDDAARDALGQVADTGREALAGLRAMLRVLDAGPSGTAALPSLEQLPALVAAAATPQHAVTLAVAGERAPLTPDAEVALVRVAQEGITNALRHLEAPVAVEVRLTWSDAAATLEVRDDGGARVRAGTGGSPDAGGGSGLVGLAERVTAAGGVLDVDRAPDGWRVSATVPVRTAATSGAPS